MPKTASHLAPIETPSSHRISDDLAVLADIVEPEVNLCLWQRPAQPAISGEVAQLSATSLADVRCPTTVATFDRDLCQVLAQQGLDPARFPKLRVDLRSLAEIFSVVCDSRELKFRLATTDRDECRRFHVDRRNLRLLCTYRGPGTEWLMDEQVDRRAQASGAPNEAVIRYGEPSHFQPFWVGIMRGDPHNEGTGLVHRSPTISGTAQVRVLFCLDS